MVVIKKKPEDFVVKEISSVKPAASGEYVYAVLSKTDWTTMGAVRKIADFLRLPLKTLGFAGAKDKAAVTEQVISIKAGKRDIIRELQGFSVKGIEVRAIGKGDSPISLGDLEGNQFRIVVREASKAPRKLLRFINLFGEQRFSTDNASAGKLLVRGEFAEAAALMDEPEIKKHLESKPSDVVGALKQLPKKILTIYIHAYQSLLWNRLVERFLEGKKAEEVDNIMLPIIGFGTELDKYSEEIAELCRAIMAEENINERDFIIRSIPDLSSDGGTRALLADVKNLRVTKKENDVFVLEFSLPKGCYATEFIRQAFE